MLHSLFSIVKIWRAVTSVIPGCIGGDVALEALVGCLQVVVAGSLVRRRAETKILEAGKSVEGGFLSCRPAVLAHLGLIGCLALIGCGDIHHPP